MITTTLSQLPNSRPYEAVGVVMGIARIGPGSNTQDAARQQMEKHAESMGADAIIDIHLHMEAPASIGAGRPAELAIALIGTAIKFV